MGDADATADVEPPEEELDTIDGVDRRSRPPTVPASLPSATDYSDLVTVERSHYERGELIAQGGMGRVVKARDKRLGRDVAIKELLPKNRDAARRFEREARITARLQHPAIIHVYEAGVWTGGEPFYAMTKVEGRSLDKVVGERKTLADRLGLVPNVIAVADALAYAHNANVIHRDLKPSNVLVGAFGETVVIDWGLAKDLGAPPDLDPTQSLQMRMRAQPEETNVGSVVGTPAYMPPEQAHGRVVDRRADVYSLGALLYHVLVGAAPYTKDTAISSLDSKPKRGSEEILELVKTRPCVAIGKLEPNAPADLIAIVSKAMERAPGDRYPDAGELANDLKRFQTGQLVAARNYSTPQLFLRWLGRYRVVVGIVVIALVAVGVVGGFSISQILHEKAKDELRRRTLLEDRGRSELRDGQPGRALADLLGAAEDGKVGGARGLLIADAIRPFEAELAWFPSSGEGGSLALSLDGKTVIALDRSGSIRESTVTGTRRRAFGVGARTRVLIAGSRLVTLDGDAVARVWVDGVLERELRGHTAEILDGHVSADGKSLVTGSADGTARVWNLATGRQVRASWDTCGSDLSVIAVRFSPDGQRVVSATDDNNLCYWDANTGRELALLRSHHGRIASIRWSPDPDRPYVVTASDDGTALLWDPSHGKPVIAALIHDGTPIASAEFSSDGRLVLTAGADHVARLWKLPEEIPEDDPTVKAKEQRKFIDHTAALSSAVFDANDQRIATAGFDNKAKVWDVASGELMATFEHAGIVTSVAFAPDEHLVTTSRDHTVRVWDLARGVAKVPHEVDSKINGVAISRAGAVAAATDDHLVTVWHQDGTQHVLRDHGGRVYAVVYSLDGRWLASAGEDPVAILWDATTHTRAGATARHQGTIRALAFTPDGNQLATAGTEGIVRIWSVPGGGLVNELPFDTVLRQLVFSPDGTVLAGVGEDGGVALWNLPAKTRAEPTLTSGRTRAVAFSSDGSRLVASGTDTKIWRIEHGAIAGELPPVAGPTGEVAAVAFSRDDLFVITAGSDGIVRLWDAAKGQLLGTRGARGGSINALAVSVDGATIWVGGTDKLVRGWDVAIERRTVTELAAVVRRLEVPWQLDDEDNLRPKTGDRDGEH